MTYNVFGVTLNPAQSNRHNTKRYKRQTDRRQTTQCTKGTTDSTVGQKCGQDPGISKFSILQLQSVTV